MGIARISSGVKGLDKLTMGGYSAGSINLIAGGPGSGKTILAIQFLISGILNGENGIYITFEEKKEKVFQIMKDSFGWDLEKYEKEKKFIFLEYTPEQVKRVLVEGGGLIDNIIVKRKIKRIVIDSITSFCLLYEDELSRKQASLALFELINKWGCTAILTSEGISEEEYTISAATQFEVDSIILAYHAKKNGERIRAVEILKMRGTNYIEKTVSMKIIDKKGIEIYADKVVVF